MSRVQESRSTRTKIDAEVDVINVIAMKDNWITYPLKGYVETHRVLVYIFTRERDPGRDKRIAWQESPTLLWSGLLLLLHRYILNIYPIVMSHYSGKRMFRWIRVVPSVCLLPVIVLSNNFLVRLFHLTCSRLSRDRTGFCRRVSFANTTIELKIRFKRAVSLCTLTNQSQNSSQSLLCILEQ